MLYLFDLDDTLIEGFMALTGAPYDYDRIAILPNRREVLADLRDAGHDVAIATNQGGVAFGYQTVAQVREKLLRTAWMLGAGGVPLVRTSPVRKAVAPADVYVALHHPIATIERWQQPEHWNWRKPGAGMLEQAMRDRGVEAAQAVYVGDMEVDEQAAKAAGVRYVHPDEFFGGA